MDKKIKFKLVFLVVIIIFVVFGSSFFLNKAEKLKIDVNKQKIDNEDLSTQIEYMENKSSVNISVTENRIVVGRHGFLTYPESEIVTKAYKLNNKIVIVENEKYCTFSFNPFCDPYGLSRMGSKWSIWIEIDTSDVSSGNYKIIIKQKSWAPESPKGKREFIISEKAIQI